MKTETLTNSSEIGKNFHLKSYCDNRDTFISLSAHYLSLYSYLALTFTLAYFLLLLFPDWT